MSWGKDVFLLHLALHNFRFVMKKIYSLWLKCRFSAFIKAFYLLKSIHIFWLHVEITSVFVHSPPISGNHNIWDSGFTGVSHLSDVCSRFLRTGTVYNHFQCLVLILGFFLTSFVIGFCQHEHQKARKLVWNITKKKEHCSAQ